MRTCSGVTHRDIKPGNILYATAPTDVRIGDFGLALNIGAETTQITGVGSPAYMSPEQIREELVDHRTDLYSLGVVMYQMLTGQLPFRRNNKFSMIYQITQHEPAAALGAPPRRAGVARPHRAARDAQGGGEALPQRRRVRRGPDRGAARRDWASERATSFGDADKFAVLRTMRFFSRLHRSGAVGGGRARRLGARARPAPRWCVKATPATSSAS